MTTLQTDARVEPADQALAGLAPYYFEPAESAEPAEPQAEAQEPAEG
jgi:hypothetical protein